MSSGMFPVAHAGDGGGSIRIPASCCGLVGLKPSRGRVASSVPGWQGMATEGVLTRTVADAAAVLDVISAPDPDAWWNAPVPVRPFAAEVGADPGQLRVALCTVSALGLPVGEGPQAAVGHAGRLLEAAGHKITVLEADVFDPSGLGPFLHVVNAGLAEMADIDWDRAEPHNRAAYAAAQTVDSLTFVRSLADLHAPDPIGGVTFRRRVRHSGDAHHEYRAPPGRTAGVGPCIRRLGHAAHRGRGHGGLHRRVQHHRAAGGQPAAVHGGVGTAGGRPDRGRPVARGPAGTGGLPTRAGRPVVRSLAGSGLTERLSGPGGSDLHREAVGDGLVDVAPVGVEPLRR